MGYTFLFSGNIHNFNVNDPIYLRKLPWAQNLYSLNLWRDGSASQLNNFHKDTHSCQAFDECLHNTKQMHWLLFCTLPSMHTINCVTTMNYLFYTLSTSSLGLQLHLPSSHLLANTFPFVMLCKMAGAPNQQATHESSVSPQMWQWPPPHAVCSGFFPGSAHLFHEPPNCPSHYPEHCEGPWKTRNVQSGLLLSPRLFLLIPSPITPLLLLPTEKYKSPDDCYLAR